MNLDLQTVAKLVLLGQPSDELVIRHYLVHGAHVTEPNITKTNHKPPCTNSQFQWSNSLMDKWIN